MSSTTESAKISKTRALDPAHANLNRKRFRKQLVEKLAPVLNDVLYEFYKKAYLLAEDKQRKRSKDPAQAAEPAITWQSIFQKILKEVAEWDAEVLESIVERIKANLPWFREVVRQMIIHEIYVLMSSRHDQATDDIDFSFELPSDKELVHHLLKCVAGRMRGSVSLYDHSVEETQREHNTLRAQDEIERALGPAVDSLVPIADIARKHFSRAQHEREEDAEAERAEPPAEKAVLLQSEDPAELGAAAGADLHPAHVDIVERKETLAAAAANDADAAAQTALQAAEKAQEAADVAAAAAVIDAPPPQKKRQPRRKATIPEF